MKKVILSEFIERSNKIHLNKYNYSKIDKLIGLNKLVKIICPIHNEFEQLATVHLRGAGCPTCAGNIRLTTDQFIERSNIKHFNKYDYSKVNYKDIMSKVLIICRDHGEFEQYATNHLYQSNGCPSCTSSRGETTIKNILIKNNIKFIEQYTFDDCRGLNNGLLRFDFYLPEYNICLEYDGKQHFMPVTVFGGDEYFKIQQITDLIKDQYCDNKNIKLIRWNYLDEIKIK